MSQIVVSTDHTKTIAAPTPSFFKHCISLKGSINPFIRNFDTKSDNSLYKHTIDLGINLDYVRSSSSKKAIGFEYSIRFSKLNDAYQKPYIYNSLLSLDNLNIDHEAMKIIVQQIIPKIEWRFSKQSSSYEFVHQIGIGLSIVNVLRKDYNYRLNFEDPKSQYYLEMYNKLDLNDAEINFDQTEFYNYDYKPFTKGVIIYNFEYRKNFTPSLSWALGVRTQFYFSKYSFQQFRYRYENEDMHYWITNREMNYLIWENRFKSLLTLQLGLVYKISGNI